jgi:hypothetical protein
MNCEKCEHQLCQWNNGECVERAVLTAVLEHLIPKETDLSCNKGSHRERSLINQPNHRKFWKRRGREET